MIQASKGIKQTNHHWI